MLLLFGFTHPTTGERLTVSTEGQLYSRGEYVASVTDALRRVEDPRETAHRKRLASKSDVIEGQALPFDWM